MFDGAPQWRPVTGTSLRYVANSQVPVIEVNPGGFYAVTGGVWFTSTALTGPWLIATTVPGVIYTIPVSSPLHYVTYVRVYGYNDSVVYTGYTPGYLGTVVDTGGTVVYGTGYAYSPWIGSVWYGAPLTYGVAAMPVYNPYVGFTFGFALGMTAAYWAEPYWGGAYYHAGYYGYPCCGSASANVYRSWPGGVSSGTRTYWADNGGAFGTNAAGTYSTYRGTTGNYNAQRSWNPYTGQGSQGYTRTFDTATGNNRLGDARRDLQCHHRPAQLCVECQRHDGRWQFSRPQRHRDCGLPGRRPRCDDDHLQRTDRPDQDLERRRAAEQSLCRRGRQRLSQRRQRRIAAALEQRLEQRLEFAVGQPGAAGTQQRSRSHQQLGERRLGSVRCRRGQLGQPLWRR